MSNDASASVSARPHPAVRHAHPPAALLPPWFVALVGLALLACGRALWFPPWPRLEVLKPAPFQSQLQQLGLQPRPLPSQPPRRSHTMALSPQLVWHLAGDSELRLALVNGRGGPAFQVASFTTGIPSLALQQRRLDHPQPGVASGRVQGHPALQTCLVPQGPAPARPAVTAADLIGAVSHRRLSAGDRLRGLIGFRQSRPFRCLLVTWRSTTAAPLPALLWPRLLSALQGFDRPPGQPHRTGG